MAKTVVVKKHCCKSQPRCRRCPVVLRRLERVDLARRKQGRTYVLANDLKPRQMRAARID